MFQIFTNDSDRAASRIACRLKGENCNKGAIANILKRLNVANRKVTKNRDPVNGDDDDDDDNDEISPLCDVKTVTDCRMMTIANSIDKTRKVCKARRLWRWKVPPM